jgi:hypothetical protein
LPQGYSTMGYVDRPAYWRLAHFQRGCGAAVPWRAISACDSCFAFLQLIVNARVTCRSIEPAFCFKSASFPLSGIPLRFGLPFK